MNISESMVRYYLADVLLSWFNTHDLPPDDLSEYREYILDMKKGAIKHGDLEALRLAFEHILDNSHIDSERFNESLYPYDDRDVREIIHYSWKTIWPDASPVSPSGRPDVKLVSMSLEKWWATRRQLAEPRS